MKQTAVEWLIDQMLKQGYFDGNKPLSFTNLDHLQQQAKEMEKQQIIDAYYGYELYLDREFRFQQGGQAKILTFDQWYETYGSKGSDEVEKSEKPINLTSSQTEISDEEIEKWIEENYKPNLIRIYVYEGIKWYREQLKQRQ